MKKKLLTIASVCLVLALATLSVISCAEAKPTGGVLRIASPDDALSLGYPPNLREVFGRFMSSACLETVLCLDETGAPAPWLATAWEVDVEAKTVTLTLREGVKFHDGTDFNAEAVKWNIDKLSLEGQRYLKMVGSVDSIDDYTVRLNLSEWDNTVIGILATSKMISPTAYQTHGEDWCEKNPVGTGPFKFVSWERDVGVKFERFDDYWQEGKPYLDRIEITVIADPMVQVASFKAGELDVLTYLDAKNAKDLETSGRYSITKALAQGGMTGLAGDSIHPNSVFADIRVRQAVWYAIDNQPIVNNITHGMSAVSNQWAIPGTWSYNPDVVGYPYNPEKARQLLAEAGYPDGLKTSIYCRTGLIDSINAFTAVQSYLAEVGIDAEVEVLQAGRFDNLVVGGGWENGLAYVGMGWGPDPITSLQRVLHSNGILWASSIIHPADLDEAIDEAIRAPDFQTKQTWIYEVQRLHTDKYAIVVPVYVGTGGIAAKYPEVHDDGIYEITGGQWTPADAWLDK